MAFLSEYNLQLEKSRLLYENGFLVYIRYSIKGMIQVLYNIIIKLNIDCGFTQWICLCMDGEMNDSMCVCPVGQSKRAYCKHVLIVLNKSGQVILEKTCTQKLQTFHRPSKIYTDSPQAAARFRRRINTPSLALIENDTEDFKIWYKNFFRNLIIGCRFNKILILAVEIRKLMKKLCHILRLIQKII